MERHTVHKPAGNSTESSGQDREKNNRTVTVTHYVGAHPIKKIFLSNTSGEVNLTSKMTTNSVTCPLNFLSFLHLEKRASGTNVLILIVL